MATPAVEPLKEEVSKTLNKIIKNANKKDVDIKANAQKALDLLNTVQLKDAETEILSPDFGKNIDLITLPLLQAFEPQNKLIKFVVNALQRLVSSGFVRATHTTNESTPQLLKASSGVDVSKETKDAPPKQLIGKMVERACRSVESDETTQIAIVKFLQTCCTTPTANIHGSILLNAVRCCFQLFIISKPKTQLFTAVKKSITDIINHLFQQIKTTKAKKHVRNSLSIANLNDLLQMQQHLLEKEQQQQSRLSVKIEKPDSRPDKHRIVSEILNEIIEDVVSNEMSISGPGKEGIIVEDIMFSDFCMIFAYVCVVASEQPKSNIREFHGKLLALQILHTMISNSATTLRSSKKFVNEILREHLVAALTNNAGATGKVFQYVLSIFADLLQHFREYLMNELGAFFTKSLLPRMETSSATQELYWILAIFSTICKDGTMLLDLFVNYDCDPHQENVYQKSIEALCKATGQALVSGQRFISAQHYSDFQIRSIGLKSIVQLTKTLGDWRDNEKGTATLAHTLEQRSRKTKVEQAKKLFTESPRKGLEMFISLGETTKAPADIAKFLRNYKGLDKTSIGEYISKKENPEILVAFSELFDFSSMEFDLGLRFYLSTFRLPGESMLIERIVQQFANKYYADNAGSYFANSDTAFILAYSTIMLATDQHNPNVKQRMTFAQWAKNNSKINDGKDLDETYLQGIYERIGKTPLKLNDSSAAPVVEEKQQLPHTITYSSCYRLPLVKHMMDSTWQYVVDVLNFFMHNCDDNTITDLCLTGYQNAVHISGIFELEASRAKFLESMIKFAKIDNPREVNRKDVETIRALSVIFLFEGEHLGVDWAQVLRCLSHLAQLFRLGTAHEIIDPVTDLQTIQDQKNELATLKENRQELPKQEHTIFDATNIATMIRQITINSTLLPEEQLMLFVEALCKVSQEEIFTTGTTPSVFSLQTLTDVVYYNLCLRSSATWSRVWLIISSHYIKVATSDYSLAIRKASLDAMEYLLSHFFGRESQDVAETFYKDLFFPFDRSIRLCNDHTTRSLILQYVAQIVGNNCAKIRTGWKTVFSIYTWSANCNEVLVEMGLATVEDILREYFPHFATNFFVEFVNCISAFANAKLPNISIRAIDGISACAVHLANGRVYPPTPMPREPNLKSSDPSPTQMMFTDEQEHLVLWIPVLTALSDVLSSHDLHTVRLCALDTLERVLVLFGSMFSPKLWEMIFRGVLLPIFNNIGYSKGRIRFPEESQEWLSTTCPHAFRLLMDVFTNFVETIDFLSSEILQLVASCILQFSSEELLRLGAQSLLRFTTTNGSRFSEEVWDLVTLKIDNIIAHITVDQPEFLVTCASPPLSSGINIPPTSPTLAPPAALTASSSLVSPSTPPTSLRQSLMMKSPPLSPLRSSSNLSLPAPLSAQNNTPSPIDLRNKVINLSSTALSPSEIAAASANATDDTNSPNPNSINNNNNAITNSSGEITIGGGPVRPKLESHAVALQLMVQIVESIATSQESYVKMTAAHLRSLAEALEAAYTFCHAILGKMVSEKISLAAEHAETLDSTEFLACSCYLKILFTLNESKDAGNKDLEKHLIRRCYMFFSNYLKKERVNQRIIVQLLKEFKNISEAQFTAHLGIFYHLLVQLMMDESEDIRKALQPVWRRIGSVKGNIRASSNLKPPLLVR